MSRGLGVVQRRILETLERIEENYPGAWVLRIGLVTPKPGQRLERADRSKTERAVTTLATRGLVECRSARSELGLHPVVRLIKEGRPTLLNDADEADLRIACEVDAQVVNDTLRRLGSRVRVKIVDAEEIEYTTVLDMETGTPYRATYLF
ncbi:hypothetical protein ABZ771_34325 [Streptomyces globisporus]|uniref:hypothetical protein n=1 Tax=Streptomyces globisporus TaxID=1908 RepID=UPI0034614F00